MRLLVVTAVEAEQEAITTGLPPDLPITVAAVGVGPAAAGAATSRLLTLAAASGARFHRVIAAGLAGGFAGRAAPGDVVLATRSVAADLGADSPDGFLTLDELGFGRTVMTPDPRLFAQLREALPTALPGAVLSVSTATGTDERAAELSARYPDAIAEAMEGYGVACAAALAGAAFAELRTISNQVGTRDREAWRIPEALAALTGVASVLARLATPPAALP